MAKLTKRTPLFSKKQNKERPALRAFLKKQRRHTKGPAWGKQEPK